MQVPGPRAGASCLAKEGSTLAHLGAVEVQVADFFTALCS